MACFTASIPELRHDQIFILPVIMNAKLNKKSNFQEKNIIFLKL
jgi:hypothetical protein